MSNSVLVLVAVCLMAVVLTSPAQSRTLPDGLRQSLLKRSYDTKCRFQGNACDPYGEPCCSGMKCANFLGGYCLKGVEKCLCLPETYGL